MNVLEMRPFTGISRFEKNKSNGPGWYVRLKYENGRPLIQKVFKDHVYGGMCRSLSKAKAFRDSNFNYEIGNKFPIFKWKNRTTKTMRSIQKGHRKETIVVGIGINAAKIAYDHGMSKVTCWKIRSGRKDRFTVNNGGWHTPYFEEVGFISDITEDKAKEITTIVNNRAPHWFSDVEKHEISSEIFIKISTHKESFNLYALVSSWIKAYIAKNYSRREIPLDLNGDIEYPEYA